MGSVQTGPTMRDCAGKTPHPRATDARSGGIKFHISESIREYRHNRPRAQETQLSAVGFNIINSPCGDIVLDPHGTYIRTRAFGGPDLRHVHAEAIAPPQAVGGVIPPA